MWRLKIEDDIRTTLLQELTEHVNKTIVKNARKKWGLTSIHPTMATSTDTGVFGDDINATPLNKLAALPRPSSSGSTTTTKQQQLGGGDPRSLVYNPTIDPDDPDVPDDDDAGPGNMNAPNHHHRRQKEVSFAPRVKYRQRRINTGTTTTRKSHGGGGGGRLASFFQQYSHRALVFALVFAGLTYGPRALAGFSPGAARIVLAAGVAVAYGIFSGAVDTLVR
jgi:hypothetical protein